MVRAILDSVIGVVQCLQQEAPHVDVFGAVEHVTTLTALTHDAGEAELGQVLGR